MEKYCYKCSGSIKKNDGYLECFHCNALYCYHCIEMRNFIFDEDTLLYKYTCKHCIKMNSL